MARPQGSQNARIQVLLPEMIQLRQSGLSYNKIANRLGLQKATVIRTLHKYLGTDPLPMGVPEMPEGYSEISERWWNEFRGLFFGEGCIYIAVIRRKGGPQIQPILQINLRVDDHAMLDEICSKLGGFLFEKDAYQQSKPQVQWHLRGWQRFYHVLLHLAGSDLPSKKNKEVREALELCYTRFQMNYALRPEDFETLNQYRLRIKEMKLLKS